MDEDAWALERLELFFRPSPYRKGVLALGPRMGEKIVLSEKVCTLGRGEGNTIQALLLLAKVM